MRTDFAQFSQIYFQGNVAKFLLRAREISLVGFIPVGFPEKNEQCVLQGLK
jgi:hypothetical protein